VEAASPARIVVFDVGGVLVEVTSWGDAHLASGYMAEQLPPEEEFLPRIRRLNAAYDRGSLSPNEYEQAVVKASHGRYAIEDVRRIHAMQLRGEVPGVDAVFDVLHEGGCNIALLSNTNPIHWELLLGAADGVAAYPTVLRAPLRLASFELRCAKPDPAIYELFVKAAGVPANALLFFDDREPNVAAARLAGWQAEHIDSYGDVAAQLLGHLQYHGGLNLPAHSAGEA